MQALDHDQGLLVEAIDEVIVGLLVVSRLCLQIREVALALGLWLALALAAGLG